MFIYTHTHTHTHTHTKLCTFQKTLFKIVDTCTYSVYTENTHGKDLQYTHFVILISLTWCEERSSMLTCQWIIHIVI